MKALGKALGKAFGLAPFLFALATPAHAEKLMFDHRLYPPLKAVLDRGVGMGQLFQREMG